MFFTGLANDLQSIDNKIKHPTKLISQGKQVGYFYDKHGRVKSKTLTPVNKDGIPLKQSSHNIVGYLESLQLFYTPNNELEKSIKIHQNGFDVVTTTTQYFYDAFGRRIGKASSTQKLSKLNQRGQLVRFANNLSSLNNTAKPIRETMLMLWDGNRQIQEITDDFTFTTVYEQDSFEPVARLVWANDDKNDIQNDIKLYHYHNNHLGTPQELTDQNGEVIWLSYDMAWGGRFDGYYKPQKINDCDILAHELQPFRFQGQCFDAETGLHYNRFRYYDSDVGMFISRDPIGLLGGNNVFQYAPNPVMWVDPWGLHSCTLSELDNKAIEAWDTLPAGKGKNLTTVAVGQGESGKLYISTNSPYVPKKIKEWANSNNVTVVQSKKPNVHAEPLNTKGERSNNRKSSDYTGRW